MKRNRLSYIPYVIYLLTIAVSIAVAVAMFYLIYNSDLPMWLKWLLLRG